MKKDKHITKVIFRYWKESSGVITIFPEIPGTIESYTCESYEHVGQHGSCCPSFIIQDSRPAKPEEYEGLKKELESIGYNLQVVYRYTQKHTEVRKNTLREYNIKC